MNIRKIWHILPEGFRKCLSEKTGFQGKIIQYVIRHKAKAMKRFNNIAHGKRCFIVGNGPSLTIEDLEKLIDEDTFGCNYIFRIFEKTKWRPTYYSLEDYAYMENMGWYPDKSLSDCKALFINGACLKNRNEKSGFTNEFFYYLNGEGAYEGDVKFSRDICKNIYEGATVTYVSLQIAIYMGYSEIYLIGVDHNYPSWKGEINTNDKENYMDGIGDSSIAKNPPSYAVMENAYRRAEEEGRRKKIKIYNVTRGGKLEIFERRDFDDLNF